ncbi:hypothetical protein K435DRAFT_772288 [Dendrothele bispora CBS 962.96]|uniref:Cupredoxin n=1 Tax=Dendrothele bispora (strain CBS 962.96) TaxID=1314807 RepID=A0A4S8MXT9_DENBC|nr:hypothetical protein K435DRAFT_772288 [Dendrothele bispora CBS 962.96]
MIFSSKFTLAAIVGLSLAVIPVARSETIDVTVGGTGIFKYDPEFVNANVGDVVRFTFKQKNHTATQSTLANPCSMAENGFDSGFIPVADDVTEGFPVAELTVTDTDPIWVYCRQTGHCQQGMVFAVNPGDKFAQFQAAATGNNTNSTTSTTPDSTATAAASASPSVVTVTATVTVSSGQTLTTTYGSYPGSAQPTSATSTDHRVTVGSNGQLVFEPANITAQVGDTVTFEFHQKNHTVTQSTFSTPCRALAAVGPSSAPGFDSGFMPVADGATNFPTFTIQINDTTPIWAYCRQTQPASHCGQGMVFSVNAIESGANNFEAFKAKAVQQNGSTSDSTSGSTSTNSTDNAALSNSGINGAGIVVAVGALFFSMLL